jgi:hypothetical protein
MTGLCVVRLACAERAKPDDQAAEQEQEQAQEHHCFDRRATGPLHSRSNRRSIGAPFAKLSDRTAR